MMPKSTAANGQQVGGLAAERNSTEKANNRARGMLIATMRAMRTLLRKHQQDDHHEEHAHEQILLDRFGGDTDQLAAVIIFLELDTGQQSTGFRIVDFPDAAPRRPRGQSGEFALA